MFHQIYHEIVDSLRNYPTGGLMILAQGISQTQVTSLFVLNFLDKTSNLIILLNFSYTELQMINTLLAQYVTENRLDTQKYSSLVISISKFTSQKRKQCYLSGGIYNISSQIIVQDILNGILEPKLLTHLIIQRVEVVQYKHDFEAFLTVLIKQSNLRIFLLALTDRAIEVQIKQNVPTILRYLFLPQVFPWPFNRVEIVKNLQEQQFIWKEHVIPLKPSQLKIQDAIINLMTECVQEINRVSDNKAQLSLEQILHSSKYKIYSQLRRLKALIKNLDKNQLIIDLFRFKRLLFDLIEMTDVGLMNVIQEFIQNSPTESIVLIPESNIERQLKSIVEGSKQRVFQIHPSDKSIKYRFPILEKLPEIQFQDVELPFVFRLNFKVNIKHGKLGQLLDNIFTYDSSEEKRVWILCKNIWAKKQVFNIFIQIENYLNYRYLWGDETQIFQQLMTLRVYLERVLMNKKQSYHKTLANPEWLYQKIQGKNIPQLRRQQLDLENFFLHLLQFELEEFFNMYQKIKDQIFCSTHIQAAKDKFQILPNELFQLNFSNKISTIDETGELILFQEDKIKQGFIVSVNFLDGSSERIQYFEEYKPHFLIAMDPSNIILREVSLTKQDYFKELHLLFFQNSIESQIFYREKIDEDDAFQQIIQQCSQMPQYNELPKDLIKNFEIQKFQSSRVGKGADFFLQQSETQPYMIVDFREFRSEIPALLFYAGFKIISMMLKTGDYILSNKVVIERKCVETGDFSESLFGKRLDEQMKRLCDYEFPMLLIEYSDRIPFDLASLQRGSFIHQLQKEQKDSADQQITRQKTKILQRLFELTTHYPKIHILWSKSPQNSIDIIKQIKQTLAQDTPDVESFRKQQQKEEEVLDLQNTQNQDDLEKLIL